MMKSLGCILAAVLLCVALALAGCGGGGSNPPPNNPALTLNTSISGFLARADTGGGIAGALIRCLGPAGRAAGDTVLASTTTDANGAYTLSFHADGDINITIIAEPPAGSGLAQIVILTTISAGSTVADVGIRVITPELASHIATIGVSPNPAQVSLGTTQQFTADIRDDGQQIMTLQPTWTVESSNNTAIGRIDGNGKFTALKAGTCTVVALCGGRRGEAVVTVTTVPCTWTVTTSGASSAVIGFQNVDSGNGTGSLSLSISESGVSITGFNAAPPDFASIGCLRVLPLGPAVGQQWTESISSNGFTLSATASVASVTDTVTVYAGTYTNCVRLDETITIPPGYSRDSVAHRSRWFALGVGPVKYSYESGGTTSTGQLTTATISPAGSNDLWPLQLGNTWAFSESSSSP